MSVTQTIMPSAPTEGFPPVAIQYLASISTGDGITSESISAEGRFPVYGGNGRRGFVNRHNCDGNVVLVGRVGALCGNVHLVNERIFASEHALVVTPRDGVDASWLAYALRMADLGKLSQSSAQPLITQTGVGQERLPTPSLDEQRRVAAFLGRETGEMDAMVTKLDRLVERLSQRRVSASENLLNSAALSTEYKPVWSLFEPVKLLGHPDEQVLSVYREHGVIPKSSREDNHNRTPEDLSRYQLVRPGDLVVNKMKAWQGSMGVSQHRGIVSPDYQVARPVTDDNPKYLHFALRSHSMVPEYRVRSMGVRPSQWRLYWEQLAPIRVAVPPPTKQAEVVAHLDRETAEIDKMIADAEQLKSLIAERRSALITEVVTGRKKV